LSPALVNTRSDNGIFTRKLEAKPQRRPKVFLAQERDLDFFAYDPAVFGVDRSISKAKLDTILFILAVKRQFIKPLKRKRPHVETQKLNTEDRRVPRYGNNHPQIPRRPSLSNPIVT